MLLQFNCFFQGIFLHPSSTYTQNFSLNQNDLEYDLRKVTKGFFQSLYKCSWAYVDEDFVTGCVWWSGLRVYWVYVLYCDVFDVLFVGIFKY